MKTAVIYARFSSDRQNETSIEAQVRACMEYATTHGLSVAKKYIDEAVSGRTTNRNAYQAMMKAAKLKKFDVILIHKYDRIGRNLYDHVIRAAKLAEYGITLIAVAQDFGDSKEGRMMMGIQWIMTQYYSENLSEEVRKGMKETALKGLHNGGVAPFGYRIVDKRYEIEPIEAAYVRRMFEACIKGSGYNEIINDLSALGIKGHRGKPIGRTQIYEILHNEKYTGTYVYSEVEETERTKRRDKPNAIRVAGALPEIVSKEVFEKAREVMSKWVYTGKNNYRCSGIVYCGECGAKMHITKSVNKGHTYLYYRCTGKCGNKAVNVEAVDKAVDMYIEAVMSEKNRLAIYTALQDYVHDEKTMLAEFEEERARQIEKKQAEIENLTANLSSGALTPAVAQLVSEKIEKEMENLEKIKTIKPVRNYTPSVVNSWLNSLVEASEKELPKVLVERIEIKDRQAKIVSTLGRLLGEVGCGGSVERLPIILLYFAFNLDC